MIKAIFLDIDGTLYSHKSMKIPESTKEALKMLRGKGIKIFIATGRDLGEIQALSIDVTEYDGLIMLNGQLCVDEKGEILYESPIEEMDLQELVRNFKEKTMPILLIEKECTYINYVDDIVLEAQKTFSLPTPQVGEYSGGHIYQACVYANAEQEEQLMRHLKMCKTTRWNKYGIDLIAKNGGKDIGISHVLKLYGIKREECMAFGDGENDIDMLSFAGIGVAMGNAEECVKACADYVTADIEDDGIYKALKNWNVL